MNQELEQKKIDFEWLKGILSNLKLLKWVVVFTAEGLKDDTEKTLETFKEKIIYSKDSLVLMDNSNVCMLITNAELKGEPIAKYSLEYINSIIKIMGTEGSISIYEKDYPSFLEFKDDNKSNVVVLAPRVGND
ncbi:MAG: hypothetical protein AABY22_15605 [Nanoarchaeota archaeon]